MNPFMNITQHWIINTNSILPPFRNNKYDYLLGRNGLFVQTQTKYWKARIPVEKTRVTGRLKDIEPAIELLQPKIPSGLLVKLLDHAKKYPDKEVMYQIKLKNDRFTLHLISIGESHKVDYEDDENALLDCHSHHNMQAYFSSTDDRNELANRFYMVIGQISSQATAVLRIGINGHFWELPIETLIAGKTPFKNIHYGSHYTIDSPFCRERAGIHQQKEIDELPTFLVLQKNHAGTGVKRVDAKDTSDLDRFIADTLSHLVPNNANLDNQELARLVEKTYDLENPKIESIYFYLLTGKETKDV